MVYVLVWAPDGPFGEEAVEVHASREAAVRAYVDEPEWQRWHILHGGLLVDLPMDATDAEIIRATCGGMPGVHVFRASPVSPSRL